jgi:hypothetical protein
MKSLTDEGEVCRGYQVQVCKVMGMPLAKTKYGEMYRTEIMNGSDSIATMRDLLKRGFDCVSITVCLGVEVESTLEEMEVIVLPGF